MTVTNAGPETSGGASLSNTLPPGVTVVSLSGACTTTGGAVNCEVPPLLPGAAQGFTIDVIAPATAGNLVNTASVFNGIPNDPQLSNNFAFVTTQVMLPSADLALTKTAPAEVPVGSDFTYTVTVSNLGPDFAEVVTVTDTLPNAVTFVSASNGCEHDSGTVTCALGTVDAVVSPTRTVEIVVTAPGAPLFISNGATVSSDTDDPNSGNDTETLETEVTVDAPPPGAAVSLSKSAPVEAAPNSTLSYTLVATNNGPDEAAGVMVEDTLPAGTIFLAAPAECTHAAGLVTCSLGNLEAGSSKQLSLTVMAPATPGQITNEASVVSDTDDPEPANNLDSATTTIDAAAASASLAVLAGPNPPQNRVVAPGELGAEVVQFALTNTGTESVDIGAFGLGLSGSGEASDLGTVALYRDTDSDGIVDPEDELIANGLLGNGDVNLAPASSLVLPAGASNVYLVVVDVGSGVAGIRIHTALSLDLLGLGALGWRQRRRLTVVALAGLLLLSGCITQERQQNPTYQFNLETVEATGESSATTALVTSVPLTGATLEVEP